MDNLIRVMTFNIRFDNPKDGDKRWEYRKDLVCEIIRRYHPQILGIQEATWRQIMDLRSALPEYEFCIKGRVWDDTCQYPTLIFRKDRISCKKVRTSGFLPRQKFTEAVTGVVCIPGL